MDINLLKTIVTRIFGIYSQFKSIVSDLEANNTVDNLEWGGELLNYLATELYYEANCLTDVLYPPHKKEKDETMFKIDGIIDAERNPMSEDEFFELFIKWAEENKLEFGGALGAHKEEEENEALAGK